MADAAKAMTLRLAEDQAHALAFVALVENRPTSEVIRDAIAAYIDKARTQPGFQRDLRASINRANQLLGEKPGTAGDGQ